MKRINNEFLYSPSDLANHLSCQHLSVLERQYAEGAIELEFHSNAMLELLAELGLQHEKAYLDHLASEGKSVAIASGNESETRDVLNLMKSGVDVIFQAPLEDHSWRGRADFLLRVETESTLGTWSYEVADTKLAQDTRASTVLQLCMYSEMISKLQGVWPRYMHIVKPGEPFDVESVRLIDCAAYYRLAKSRFLDFMNASKTSKSYPEPCQHCEICNWWPRCDKTWRDDDHLTFVAGMPKSQIVELNEHDIATMDAFAALSSPHPTKPKRGAVKSFEKSQRQAQIQVKGRKSGEPEYEFNAVEAGKGFCLLPEPNEGDVFFDIEGNPRAGGDGLEYLLGSVTTDSGTPEFAGQWALDKKSEKAEFEKFIDSMRERWKLFPNMHIYHYAPYEPSAMKRLAIRHATREDELDELLRSERFVDLYAVVLQGIRASVESYSIKELEQFYDYERLEELGEARTSLREVERLIELGMSDKLTEKHRRIVELYNKDDCLSTLALRDWLEKLRDELTNTGQAIERPIEKPGDPSEEQAKISKEVEEVYDALTSGLAEDQPRDGFESAKWLLAHTLDYFRREAKSVWWEYFELRKLDDDDLYNEKSALSGLGLLEAFPPEGRKLPVHRYSFPEQDTTIRIGDTLYSGGETSMGSVSDINIEEGWIEIKKKKLTIDEHPSSVFAFNFINAKPLPDSLLEFGRSLASATAEPIDARYDLLAQRKPRLKTLQMPLEPMAIEDAAKSLVFDLNRSVLPIQGPPGAGKTYVGSRMIAALAAKGKRVGVTAVSHKVILNLLEDVIANAESDSEVQVAHQGGKGNDLPAGVSLSKNKDDSLDLLDKGFVVGGTAWLWSNEALIEQLDYLFIDEAGQMALAVALAAGRAAKNIVLLGDPQQLEQPQKGNHPEGAEVAALTHLLRGKNTIEDDSGLFLPSTWRLNPEICKFTSELYYDGRLTSKPGLENQQIVGPNTPAPCGLNFTPVGHTGNQSKSLEEVQAIESLISSMLDDSHSWIDRDGVRHGLTISDFLVVAPFNAQVVALEQRLPLGAKVGTVDKFQGQQAPIVIYSMTCSTPEDAPRGMGFLFSPNRLNVASSRAMCLTVIVASPALLKPSCKFPEHVRLANGLCRFYELASE